MTLKKRLEPGVHPEAEEAPTSGSGQGQQIQEVSSYEWKNLYTDACREGNMSPKTCVTHPGLKLRPARQMDRHRARNERERFAFRQDAAEAWPQTQLPVLSSNIQLEILRHVLVTDDYIHPLSRLDHFERPQSLEDLPHNKDGNPQFYHKFFIGSSGQSTSVKYAQEPAHLLSVLSVCKLWHVLGCHLFYGLNTFAFSSLGE